jgi:hypothetical protein
MRNADMEWKGSKDKLYLLEMFFLKKKGRRRKGREAL